MSDKLSNTVSTEIAFTDGEGAPARKFTAISAQLKRVSNLFEKAIGDIHSQSWPYHSSNATLSIPWGRSPSTGSAFSSATNRFLDIANLARLIGPASNLNPQFLTGAKTIVEAIPVGVHEFALKFPVATRNSSNPIITDPGLTNWSAQAFGISAAGDYTVSPNGRVFCFTETTGGTITYDVDAAAWNSAMNYQGARFNVIPDPNQLTAGGAGCTIGALTPQSRYPVTLPTCTHQQANIGNTSVVLSSADVNYGVQLKLPIVLENNFTSGDQIPDGFLFLKNWTTNEVYEDATYYYDTSSSIEVGGVDLSTEISAGDKFCIITVGTDITTSIDDIRRKLFHTHDRSNGEPYVDIDGIAGQVSKAGESGSFTRSNRPGNYFPQYLHRDGYTTTYDNSVNDRNAMRGDIMFGISGGSAGSYIASTGESYGVKFGGNSSVASINRDSSNHLYYYSGSSSRRHKFDGGVIQSMQGYVGDTVGLVNPSPYATYGSFSTTWADVFTNNPHTVTITPAIAAKSWWNCTFAFNPTGDKWIQQHGDVLHSEYGFTVYWEETAGTTTPYIIFVGPEWSALGGSTSVIYRLVVTYEGS